MKNIQRKIGIICFCVSLVFGIYTLKYQDYPFENCSPEISITQDQGKIPASDQHYAH